MKNITAGESHGKALISVLIDVPAGIEISTHRIVNELARRRGGLGRGARQKFETDKVTLLSGVLQGKTIASPVAIMVENAEWEKWSEIMSPDTLANVSQIQPNMPSGEEDDKLQKPRPGHADLEGMRKFGFSSAREVLERSSARETAARVAAGAVAKAFIEQVNTVEITSEVVNFGGENDPSKFGERLESYQHKNDGKGDTIGGIIEIRVKNVPFGLGSYVTAEERIDSRLAAALTSIQAIKGVEIGEGFNFANLPGTMAHDSIVKNGNSFSRVTNHAGGIEGGITNGEEIVLRAVVKPIPSVPGGLKTINVATGQSDFAHSQRSDLSAVFPACVVAEAEVALVIADAIQQKFGHDSVAEIIRNYDSFKNAVIEQFRTN